jgi:hypothetical protein
MCILSGILKDHRYLVIRDDTPDLITRYVVSKSILRSNDRLLSCLPTP